MSSILNADQSGFSFSERTTCRVCGCELDPLWHLGTLALTGHFPRPGENVPSAPMHVMHCTGCTLVQLGHDYNVKTFFGENYGYRSGLNASMVSHLAALAGEAELVAGLEAGDLVIDIGGNDGTTLSKFRERLRKVIVDPTASNWNDYIPSDVEVLAEFFRGPSQLGQGTAKLITSISMLYDLPAPREFMQNIFDTLRPGGYWLTEQSDLAQMLEQNSFDTVCHEHLEYYSREVLLNIALSVGFVLVSESVNEANGGSRRLYFQKPTGGTAAPNVLSACNIEATIIRQREAFLNLAKVTARLGEDVRQLIGNGKVLHGLGASTKGNTLLQVLGITRREMACVAEINPRKYGCETPGTNIPIVSEPESLAMAPDHYLVLPWHFRAGLLKNWGKYGSAQAVFPLPRFEVV